MSQKTFNWIAWGLVIEAIVLCVFAWGSRLNWELGSLNGYQWFPLFGIVAWTIMAGHFYTGALRILNPGLKKPKGYSKVTGWIVLASLLLHPGILALEQSSNGQGTPPESFVNYVGDNLKLAAMLGTISLLIFLSFEVFERLKHNRTIKKYWWAVSVSQSLAMILIFVHALRLGTDVMSGWFRIVWFAYGLVLIPAFYLIHKNDFRSTDKEA